MAVNHLLVTLLWLLSQVVSHKLQQPLVPVGDPAEATVSHGT